MLVLFLFQCAALRRSHTPRLQFLRCVLVGFVYSVYTHRCLHEAFTRPTDVCVCDTFLSQLTRNSKVCVIRGRGGGGGGGFRKKNESFHVSRADPRFTQKPLCSPDVKAKREIGMEIVMQ